MTEQEFLRLAQNAGFTPEMANFMLDQLALKPHSHMAEEILDFDESVTQIIEDTGDEEEDEE